MKVVVFDFDQTLVSTPEKHIGVVIYKEKTGSEWSFEGWWGRKETLDTSVFDFKPIPHIKALYDRYKSEGYVLIMLTGRIKRLSDHVIKVLKECDYDFDEYLFADKGDTLTSKLFHLKDIVDRYVGIEELVIIDDREDHKHHFHLFIESLPVDITGIFIDSKIKND